MSEVTSSDNPKCKHYNVGYCRYKDDCKLNIPKKIVKAKTAVLENVPKEIEEIDGMVKSAKEEKAVNLFTIKRAATVSFEI